VLRVKRYGEAMAKKTDGEFFDALKKLLEVQIYSPPQADQKRMTALVAKFRTSKDRSGKLKYPRFVKHRARMGQLMETSGVLRAMPDGMRKLQHAYAMAEMVDGAIEMLDGPPPKRSYRGTSRSK
jgi:hypothetical protein